MQHQFDAITEQLIQSLINSVNRTNAIVDGARLVISSHFAGDYVYASQACRRVSHKALAVLEHAGVIRCSWHLEVLEDFQTLKFIDVPQGQAFLAYLGVSSQADLVANATDTLLALTCGEEWIDQKIHQITERWRLGARYLALGPEHLAEVVVAVKVAQGLSREPIRGRSLCALGIDWFHAPHVLHEHQAVIALFCESQIHPQAKTLPVKEQLASLGLLHGSALVHMRGPLLALCDSGKHLDAGGWSGVAVSVECIYGFKVLSQVRYVLTIENFTLYQRYIVANIDSAVILYVGDFPSHGLLALYNKLLQTLPSSVPLFHWGDIDIAGFKVLLALQDQALSREVKPFQMGAQQVRKFAIQGVGPQIPLPLNTLRKLAFSSQNTLRDTLIDIASLPKPILNECASEAMPLMSPVLHTVEGHCCEAR